MSDGESAGRKFPPDPNPAEVQAAERRQILGRAAILAQSRSKVTFGPLEWAYEELWHAAETVIALEVRESCTGDAR